MLIRKLIHYYVLFRMRKRCISFGAGNCFHRTLVIQGNAPVSIGNNVFIARECLFSIRKQGLIIEDNVMIGPRCMIYDWNHCIDPLQFSIRDNATKLQSNGAVHLMNDCWIGAGSIILSGVSIGKGSVIAAGSVVTKNVDNYAVVSGNPARFNRWRKSVSL